MPDPSEQQMSSQEMVEIKTSLAIITTTGNFIKEELAATRDRIHTLGGQLQPLMGIPEQIREMKDQHREMRTRMEDVQTKMNIVTDLMTRVGKLEPLVDSLVRDGNQARGAIWGSRVFAAVTGAAIAALAYLGFIKHP
jgi:chromosome condensin MukBEF ATPase and DNA-binding subunit MukB